MGNVCSTNTLASIFCNLCYQISQGAKAAQKRERNAKTDKGKTSQKKPKEAPKSIICQSCRQDFFITTREPALEEHAQNKHSKTMAECFPTFGK
ncbi:At2g23090 like protein [Lentinula boryana]|uniref:At2g23090 like protein n=1 Tax=Lentinula boryana TaxID=40481 RepID=A0ABQ8QJ11_9AGAR|nr:At2g23090 like protein [Lentinula boryana]